MKRIFKFFNRQWYFLTHKEFYYTSNLTPEEFKELWNKNLEEMKIKE